MSRSLRTVASGALLVGALLAAGWPGSSSADPDFPEIPQTSTDLSQESGAPQEHQGPTQPAPPEQGAAPWQNGATPGQQGAGTPAEGLASPEDCAVIKHLISHIDVILKREVPVAQGFPTKKDGEEAVSADLDVFNQALPFLVAAEAGVQDPVQRAKVTKYKNDLGQVSVVLAERKTQDLLVPAPYAWVDRLSAADNQSGQDYLSIANSCVV